MSVEQRTTELKKLLDVYETERDKLYDQVANLQGQKERLDWSIRVVNAFIAQIEKEEAYKAAQAAQMNEALQVAKEKGNVGTHPDERKGKLAERRSQAKSSKSTKGKKKTDQ